MKPRSSAKRPSQTLDDLRQAIEILVITQGGNGSHIYLNGDRIEIPIFPTAVKDPTGGGDAFRAGFIRGMMEGWPMKLAGEVGALCATYVLEQVGTQNHRYTLEAFVERFRTQFDDEGLLDSLLQPTTS